MIRIRVRNRRTGWKLRSSGPAHILPIPSPSMRRLSLLLALTCALGLVACGEDEDGGGSTRDARELLQRGFNTDIESGRLSLDADVQIDGPDQSFGLELSGPFASNGPHKLPSLDLDVSFSGLGPALSAGLIVTEDNAFVSFGGEDYEIGEELIGELNRQSEEAADGRTTLEDFGVDVSRWVRDPEVTGEEDVAGTSTTKVSGLLDAEQVVADLAKLTQELGPVLGEQPLDLSDEDREQIGRLVEESRIDAYVAEDGTLRRLTLDIEFQVPEGLREQADGVEGGSAKIDLTLSEVGESHEIEAPTDARPIDELLGRFGLGEESFLQ